MSFVASNRDLVGALFTRLTESLYECRLCHATRAQPPRKGYTNLVDHLTRSHVHAAVQQAFNQVQRAGVLTSVFVDVSPAAKSMHDWIEWTVMENRELSFCEQTFVRKNTKLPRTSRSTLMLCMEDLFDEVQDRIVEALRGRRIGLAFDAWSCNGYHFVAILAVVECQDTGLQKSREMYLLSFQPIDPKYYDPKKRLFDARAVIDLFDEALDRYHINESQLCFLVGDNASVNGSIGRLTKLPLIGCANHRLNLAVEQHLALYADEITKVEKLIRHLRTSKVRSILRKIDCPSPLLNNATRWSSTFLMLKRYTKIAPYLDETSSDLAPYLLSPQERVNVVALLEDLGKFQSVCMKLQVGDGVTLRDVRVLFDKLLDEFKKEGTCVKHLTTDAKVVKAPNFENGIVKVQEGREKDLSRAEKQALSRFLCSSSLDEEAPSTEKLGFAVAALREKRAQAQPTYANLDWIPPTSDDVERLFSKAGLVYTDRRMAMLPETLELILYLRFNKSLWNEVAVAKVLRRREEASKRKRQMSLLDDATSNSVV